MPDWIILVIAGSFLIFLGFFMVAFGMMRHVKESEEEKISHEMSKDKKVKGGGVIFIGPVPVVFGADKKYALLMMILAIVLILLAIIFLK